MKGNYTNSLALAPTDFNEILTVVHNIAGKKSFGVDGVLANMIKHSSLNNIATPLSHIINLSMQMGCFPDQLKIAKICPIFKSGDKTDMQNYRPISLLPCFSKIFEKIMFNRLSLYVEKTILLITPNMVFEVNTQLTWH